MYDKFDEDIAESGLRFDGNRPSYNRKMIRTVIRRAMYIFIAVTAVFFFIERQRYSLNDRHLTGIHTGGTVEFTSFYGTSTISNRTLTVESGSVTIPRIHYINGGGANAQIRFHLLTPNPFFGGDLNKLNIDAKIGNQTIPAPQVYMKSFWGCQMLNVTFTLTESTVPSKMGDTVTVTVTGEGIAATLTLVLP
jgi:hypothetical protein